MSTPRIIPALLPLLLAMIPAAAGQDPPAKTAPPVPKEPVEDLVKQLSSPRFPTREAATRKLLEREEALPALLKLMQSGDLEAQRRAGRVVAAWREKHAKRELQRLLARCKGGEVDSFVEQMTAIPTAVNDETWQAVLDLAEAVVKAAGVKRSTELSIPGRDLMKHPATTRVAPGLSMVVHRRLITDSLAIDTHIVQAAVVSGGPVRTGSHLVAGILFANGDVKLGSHVVAGVIICDGNVEVGSHVVDSVILARGKVKVSSAIRNSVIKENEPNPLGLIKFFDPAALGLELAGGQGGVQVKAVHDGKRFARAGLRKGDIVAAISGTTVSSLQSCRRVLRRRVLEDKVAIFRVRRGDNTLDITVQLAE